MTREDALSRLRPLQADLQRKGITSLYLFGSTARDEAGDESDVDLAFDVTSNTDFSILHQEIIRCDLESRLGAPVDLVGRRSLSRIKSRAETDLVRVF